ENGRGTVELTAASGPALVVRGVPVTVRGLVLHADGEAAVTATGSALMLDECDITGGGVMLFDGAPVLRNCRVHDSTGTGVHAHGTARLELHGTSIARTGGYGLLLDGSVSAVVENCDIGRTTRAGLLAAASTRLTLRGSTLRDVGAEGLLVTGTSVAE